MKSQGVPGWYHIYGRSAAHEKEYPLERPLCKARFLALVEHYAQAYCCGVAAINAMGNHTHAVVRFDPFQKLSGSELFQRALLFYPKSEKRLRTWKARHWERFHKRLFDLSEFMRNIQWGYATWYNRTHRRKGHFWGDQFKSTVLADAAAVRDAVLYVDCRTDAPQVN